ncbi:MAG: hypothetical protein DBX59_04825 [Bacillota bacterium]|nr:MAG: hypothetical protein DBX59_04825 [Bacillota bacterium]
MKKTRFVFFRKFWRFYILTVLVSAKIKFFFAAAKIFAKLSRLAHFSLFCRKKHSYIAKSFRFSLPPLRPFGMNFHFYNAENENLCYKNDNLRIKTTRLFAAHGIY